MYRSARGYSLLEFAVVAIVLSVVLTVFLQRLTFYQEAAERAQFEATLSIYKTALQLRLAELILERREDEASTLEVENPTHWLSEKPANYAGTYSSRPAVGNWYFDGSTHELVYVANSDAGLSVEPRDGVKQLRFAVKILRQPVLVAGAQVSGIGGINLKPATVYQWQ